MARNRRQSVLPSPVSVGIAVVITTVWAASFVADILIPKYDVNPLVHLIMMGVAGAAFGHGFFKNGNGGHNGK